MGITPQEVPLIQAKIPVQSDNFTTCDYISLKNAKGVLVLVNFDGTAHATGLTLTVNQATNVAAAGAVALTTGAEFQIWLNEDTSLTDTMVKQTDAVTLVIAATQKHQVAAFYIDARVLSDGFDCIALVGAGGNAANFAGALYQLDGARYQQTTPPSAITD